jgi:hypothetical protein
MPRKLSDYAVGNAVPGGRSGVDRVTPELAGRVEAMTAAMPPELASRFKIISGFRSPERQAQVNPGVKNSRHSHGMALDLGNDPAVLDWINVNGGQYGVGFPLRHMANEQNHLEMLDPGGRRMGVAALPPAGYAASPDPGFQTGLGKFGVAEANVPAETVPMPVIPAPAPTPAPAPPTVDPELLRALSRGPSPFARGIGGTGLADMFAQPAAAISEADLPRPIVGAVNPLSRRLR